MINTWEIKPSTAKEIQNGNDIETKKIRFPGHDRLAIQNSPAIFYIAIFLHGFRRLVSNVHRFHNGGFSERGGGHVQPYRRYVGGREARSLVRPDEAVPIPHRRRDRRHKLQGEYTV